MQTRENSLSLNSLKQSLEFLPESPGVYIMRALDGEVLYVGKAKNIRSRVATYGTGRLDPKTSVLVERVHEVEPLLTSSEYEALLLENVLIKKWLPRFNICLKDGKSYPVIRVTNEPFPRVFKTRNLIRDGSFYVGPFHRVESLDSYLDLVSKLFPLRLCRGPLRRRDRPCLYYHIGRCSAPCTGNISQKNYGAIVRKVKSFLRGKSAGLEKKLEDKMQRAATALDFEEAASLRDTLFSIRALKERQVSQDNDQEKRDYLVLLTRGPQALFTLVQVRQGKLWERTFFHQHFLGTSEEAICEFIGLYYGEECNDWPETLYLQGPVPEDLQRYCQEKPHVGFHVQEVKSQRDRALLEVAKKNGEMELLRLDRQDETQRNELLNKMAELLNFSSPPLHVEGFDIAHLQGESMVASCVVFREGLPSPKNYRRFRLGSLKGKIDDYGAMREVIARRFTRLKNQSMALPSLILVDGGKGQLRAASGVLEALGLSIPVVSLAKGDQEKIYRQGCSEALFLPREDPILRFMQHVRDEAHHFATQYSKTLVKNRRNRSVLENIPGIGPARSRKLLTFYGSMAKMASQEAADLARAGGLSLKMAETLSHYLQTHLD